jgi:hypothetical protein
MMDVKATAFLARQNMIVKQFGQDAWDRFLAKQASKEPFWSQPIFTSTLIPYRIFLDFMEDMVIEFYDGDRQVFWDFGEKSAHWALTEGPYKLFLETGDVEKFVETAFPAVWNVYFTEGALKGWMDGNVAHVRLWGVPEQHIYFEFSVMGWAKGSLEVLGVEDIEVKRIKGYDSEDGEIYYQFVLGNG